VAGKREDFTAIEEGPTQSEPAAATEDVKEWLENLRPEDFADPQ
jgi:hypothetical protein